MKKSARKSGAGSQPTPGPWRVKANDTTGRWDVLAGSAGTLCRLAEFDSEGAARLAAAAPALLAALREIVDAIHLQNDRVLHAVLQPRIATAMAALAAAEGRG